MLSLWSGHMQHVIFYDGECPLCNRVVQFILKADKARKFGFAPLGGKTAEAKLAHFFLKNPDLDTLILLQDMGREDEKLMIEGKGALRILWILGGKYRWIGWLSYLPGCWFGLLYRLIARRRFRLFGKVCSCPTPDERWLP
jgi:predicted DCC family thiol-disulfide oxidoreductase YuxK